MKSPVAFMALLLKPAAREKTSRRCISLAVAMAFGTAAVNANHVS
jgi:hypothetical protein